MDVVRAGEWLPAEPPVQYLKIVPAPTELLPTAQTFPLLSLQTQVRSWLVRVWLLVGCQVVPL